MIFRALPDSQSIVLRCQPIANHFSYPSRPRFVGVRSLCQFGLRPGNFRRQVPGPCTVLEVVAAPDGIAALEVVAAPAGIVAAGLQHVGLQHALEQHPQHWPRSRPSPWHPGSRSSSPGSRRTWGSTLARSIRMSMMARCPGTGRRNPKRSTGSRSARVRSMPAAGRLSSASRRR